MDAPHSRSVVPLLGWLLAFVAAVAASVVLVLGGQKSLDKASLVDSGEAPTVRARMEVSLDKDEVDRPGSFKDRNGADEWRAEFPSSGRQGGVDIDGWFNVAGKGDVLHEWDGATVTCYLSGKHVIGVKLPDGTVLTSDAVGWHGALNTWGGGLFFAGVALVIGGLGLRMGSKAVVGGATLIAITVIAAIHLNFLRVALVLDAVVVLALLWGLARIVRGARAKVAAASAAERPAPVAPDSGDHGPSLFDQVDQ